MEKSGINIFRRCINMRWLRKKIIQWLLKDYKLADILNKCGITKDPSIIYHIAKVPAGATITNIDIMADHPDTHELCYKTEAGHMISVSINMPDSLVPFSLSDPLLDYLEIK